MENQKTNTQKGKARLEFALLFVALPLFLASPVTFILKVPILLLALGYLIYVVRWNNIPFSEPFDSKAKLSKAIWIRFSVFAIISTILVSIYLPEKLFKVVFDMPFLWLLIIFVYTVFSVIPQEWIYRYFLQTRYGDFFQNHWFNVAFNAIIFALAHLMFWNVLVLLLTFVGGGLFYHTYKKSQNLNTVIIEHSLYGLWLFTLGIGEMLAFPG